MRVQVTGLVGGIVSISADLPPAWLERREPLPLLEMGVIQG